MISAGVAGNASNVYRALRDLQDKGFIMEVANPNRWKHPRAKYYSLKDTS
jgi:DNA-binding PadR family transcriptional regulator